MPPKGFRTISVKEDFYEEVKQYYSERMYKEKLKEIEKRKKL